MKWPGLLDCLGLYFLLVLLWFSQSFAGDPGVGWHLRTGQWIFEHGAPPYSDPFLFSSGAQLWAHNQWFADLFFWLLYRAGALPLLHAFAIGLCVATYILVLAPFLSRYSDSDVPVFFVCLLCAVLGSIQWVLRPVLFSFFFFAVVYRLLHTWMSRPIDGRGERRLGSLWLLPLLFALWANIHPAVTLGLGLLFVWLFVVVIESIYSARRAGRVPWGELRGVGAIVLLCSAATLLNPYGLDLYRGIFSLIGSDYFMTLNREWFPPEFFDIAFTPFYFSVVLLSVLLLRGAWRHLSLFDFLLVFGIGFMAFVQRRYIPFWSVVVSLPLLKAFVFSIHSSGNGRGGLLGGIWGMLQRASHGLSNSSKKASLFAWTSVACVLIFIATFFQGHLPFNAETYSDFPDRLPKKAVSHILGAETRGSGRIFSTPDWGGYLIWRLYPRVSVFIDDRNVINGEEKYREYFLAVQAGDGWEEVFRKYDFEWALLQGKSPLSGILKEHLNWELVYKSLDDGNPEVVVQVFRRKP